MTLTDLDGVDAEIDDAAAIRDIADALERTSLTGWCDEASTRRDVANVVVEEMRHRLGHWLSWIDQDRDVVRLPVDHNDKVIVTGEPIVLNDTSDFTF